MTEWRDAAERGRDSGRRSPFEMVGETGLLEVDETRGSWRVPGGEHEPTHECEEQEAHTTHQSSHVLKMIQRICCARAHSEISLQELAALHCHIERGLMWVSRYREAMPGQDVLSTIKF